MTIYSDIKRLIAYGINTELIEEEDKVYVTNQLMELFGIDDIDESDNSFDDEIMVYGNIYDFLEDILSRMLDYAFANELIPENTITYRDLFDTRIMNCLVPRPSCVIRNFWDRYKLEPKCATDYYYKLSGDSNYIRRARVAKDIKWKTSTPYGVMDITINLSKPEKDPKEIAAARNAAQSSYPKCLLCKENEGYSGRINYPARQNHRIIPITLGGESWNLQYSPYVYYNEHCIVFNSEHTPMKIDNTTFTKLFDFLDLFPHYTIGSNADLPIVGGSILSHEHFQGGNYTFAMAKAKCKYAYVIKNYEDVSVGIVYWPMSVIRLSGHNRSSVEKLASIFLEKWKNYTDEENLIFAETDGLQHNTITPIARMHGEAYEVDLVLRNNLTTSEHPMGLFHPHSELHHIKKENIGLIEVMGLAVLPARLKSEMESIEEMILSGEDIANDEKLAKHAKWVEEILNKYGRDNINKDNISNIIRDEITEVFKKVLEDAGVYKCNEKGQAAFKRFMNEFDIVQEMHDGIITKHNK